MTSRPGFAGVAAAILSLVAAIDQGARAETRPLAADGARLAFITGHIEICMLKSAQAAGADFSRQEAETYCRCSAEAAANELKPDDFKLLETGTLSAEQARSLAARLDKASMQCAYGR